MKHDLRRLDQLKIGEGGEGLGVRRYGLRHLSLSEVGEWRGWSLACDISLSPPRMVEGLSGRRCGFYVDPVLPGLRINPYSTHCSMLGDSI